MNDVSSASVLEVVRAAVARVLEVDPSVVRRETHLVDDLGADSLALVEIVELVEEELAPHARPGFHLDDDDLPGLVTVGAAVDYAVARL